MLGLGCKRSRVGGRIACVCVCVCVCVRACKRLCVSGNAPLISLLFSCAFGLHLNSTLSTSAPSTRVGCALGRVAGICCQQAGHGGC